MKAFLTFMPVNEILKSDFSIGKLPSSSFRWCFLLWFLVFILQIMCFSSISFFLLRVKGSKHNFHVPISTCTAQTSRYSCSSIMQVQLSAIRQYINAYRWFWNFLQHYWWNNCPCRRSSKIVLTCDQSPVHSEKKSLMGLLHRLVKTPT